MKGNQSVSGLVKGFIFICSSLLPGCVYKKKCFPVIGLVRLYRNMIGAWRLHVFVCELLIFLLRRDCLMQKIKCGVCRWLGY